MSRRSIEEWDQDFGSQDQSLVNPPMLPISVKDAIFGKCESWTYHIIIALAVFMSLLLAVILLYSLTCWAMAIDDLGAKQQTTQYAKGGHGSHSSHKSGKSHHWFKAA